MRRLFQSVAAAQGPASAAAELGLLPHWRLDDLYETMDSPRFAADLERAKPRPRRSRNARAASSPRSWPRPGRAIRSPRRVRGYESLQDLVSRGDVLRGAPYAGDTSDAARAKFYGDAQEKVTALAGDLLFFELELNRLDDQADRRGDGGACAPAVIVPGWRTSARRRRTSSPTRSSGSSSRSRSRRGRLEPPVRRHDRGAALQIRGREPDARAAARKNAGPDATRARGGGERARPRPSGRTCALFTLIYDTLAKIGSLYEGRSVVTLLVPMAHASTATSITAKTTLMAARNPLARCQFAHGGHAPLQLRHRPAASVAHQSGDLRLQHA